MGLQRVLSEKNWLLIIFFPYFIWINKRAPKTHPSFLRAKKLHRLLFRIEYEELVFFEKTNCKSFYSQIVSEIIEEHQKQIFPKSSTTDCLLFSIEKRKRAAVCDQLSSDSNVRLGLVLICKPFSCKILSEKRRWHKSIPGWFFCLLFRIEWSCSRWSALIWFQCETPASLIRKNLFANHFLPRFYQKKLRLPKITSFLVRGQKSSIVCCSVLNGGG